MYWASAETAGLPADIEELVRRYYDHKERTGDLERWRESLRNYEWDDGEVERTMAIAKERRDL